MSHNAYIESNDGSHNGDFSALEDYWRLLSPSATEDTRPTSTVEDMPPSPGDYTVDPRHIMRQPFSGPSTDIEYPHLKSVGTWDSSPAVDTQSSNGTSIGETPSGAHNDPARESLPDGGQVTFTDKEFASPSSGGYLMCQLQTRVLSFTQRLPELSATVSPSPPQTTTEQQSAQTRNTPSKRRLREDQSPATVLSGLPQTTAQQPLNKKPRNLSEGQLAEDTSSATATLSGSQTVAQPKSSRSTKSKNVGVSGKPKKICVPCQVLHQKCDIHDGKDGRCGGCISAGKDGRLCQPHYLSQLECFRKGNSRVGQDRSRHIPLTLVRDDNPEREISIQPFFQNAEEVPSLTILCKRFKVERSMTLVERFEASDGKSFPVSSRPYASVAKTFDEDVKGWLERCEKPAMDDLLVADIENGSRTEATGMARWTITESRRIVDVKPGSNPVLSSALTILACAWLSGKQAIIVGDEKLDMKAVEEENSYITGKVPVPAYLDCQLDNATIAHMERHMKKVVNGLKSLMGLGGGKPKSSLETFFTVFILLYTIELVYTLQIRYMRRHSKRVSNMQSVYITQRYKSTALIF